MTGIIGQGFVRTDTACDANGCAEGEWQPGIHHAPFNECFRNTQTDVCYKFLEPTHKSGSASREATAGAITVVVIVSCLLLGFMMYVLSPTLTQG